MDIINYKKRDNVERIRIKRRTWLDNAVLGFKALVAITFTRSTTWTFGNNEGLSRDGTFDYRERVGDGKNNSIVVGVLDLLSSTFSQSPPVVKQIVQDQENEISNHALVRLLRSPNPFYSGKLLWKATLVDYAFGNAYWLKVRSGAGKVVALYWVPATMIEPAWSQNDPSVFISHYNYRPNHKDISYAVEDVVHFRNGMDPHNIRKGISPLGALLREIATDDEAAEYTNTILRNLGVAGMVISPATDKGKISEPDAERIKARVISRTTGDRRGEPLVLSGATKVDQLGIDPGKLDLSSIRHLPEERITTIFGTPAVLLGLGTGLQNATFSNVDGLRRIFYENKIIPLQEFIAADVHTQLLPDFEGTPENFLVSFDNENVRVLKEDEDAKVTRLLKELSGGAITQSEYRALRGMEPIPGPDVYMLATTVSPKAVDKVLESAASSVPVVPSSDGTGSSSDTGNSNSTDAVPPNSGAKSRDASTKDIGDSIERIRTRMRGQCAREVHTYLTAQRDAVLAQVRNEKQYHKARINWPRVQEDYDTLKGVLEPWYKRTLVAVHDVVQDVLDTRYELTSSDERTYLKTAALNIKGINEYTRTAVAAAVEESVALDETAEELAQRIMELHVFSQERADMIARTELAGATNLAQIESYKASKVVVGVLITDGDFDEVCKQLNGLKVKMSEARSIPPLGHPNCIRRFNHIMDASELESDAAA